MKELNEKLHKLNIDRKMLRALLHKIKLQIQKNPNDELYKRRTSYRKRLTKLNNKINKLRMKYQLEEEMQF